MHMTYGQDLDLKLEKKTLKRQIYGFIKKKLRYFKRYTAFAYGKRLLLNHVHCFVPCIDE